MSATEKGAAFYAASPYLWLKLILFVGVGVLGAMNARRYRLWSTSSGGSGVLEEDLASVRTRIAIQLWMLAALVLSASLMAKGIGLRRRQIPCAVGFSVSGDH